MKAKCVFDCQSPRCLVISGVKIDGRCRRWVDYRTNRPL